MSEYHTHYFDVTGKTIDTDTLESLPYSGYVYFLKNRAYRDDDMNHIYKIGETGREDVQIRCKELYTPSGVPAEFTVVKLYLVDNHKKREKMLHKALKHCRYNSRREFFSVSPEEFEKVAIEIFSKDIP